MHVCVCECTYIYTYICVCICSYGCAKICELFLFLLLKKWNALGNVPQTVVANEILKHIKSSTSMPLMRQMLETALFVLEKDKGVLVENAFAAFAILQPLVMELIEKLDSLSATPNTKQEEVQEVQLTLDLVNSIYRLFHSHLLDSLGFWHR